MSATFAALCITLSVSLTLSLTSHAKPNIIFLCVDDWNDWVGCLGDGSVHTPNMDRLAAMGIFHQCALRCAALQALPGRCDERS